MGKNIFATQGEIKKEFLSIFFCMDIYKLN